MMTIGWPWPILRQGQIVQMMTIGWPWPILRQGQIW